MIPDFKTYIKESLWSDMQDRNGMVKIRKEDGNLSDIKPVDMGGSVLWADRDLEMAGNCYFSFDEANELIKKSGWRLPTREEVEELKSSSIQVAKSTDEVYILSKKADSDIKLIFEKKGYMYALDEKIYRETTYNAWTSSEYEHNTASWAFRIAGTYHNAFFPMDKLNRICVRLVKDKKDINESLWSDMQDKNGMVKIRKENDVDFLDIDGFFDYLINHYDTTYPKNSLDNINLQLMGYPDSPGIEDLIYMNIIDFNDVPELHITNNKLRFTRSQLCEKMCKKFHLEKVNNGIYTDIQVTPKEGEFNNSFIIEVIEFIIDNMDEAFTPKIQRKESIKESLWSDMQDRNGMVKIRKEDQEYINSINRMNFIEFFNYLQETYLPTDSKDVEIYQYSTSYSDLPMIQIPIEEVNNDNRTHIIYTIKYNPNWNGGSFVAMIVSSRFSKCYPEELEQLKNKYYIEKNVYFTPKKGKITNYACIELLDTLLSIVKKPCFQK